MRKRAASLIDEAGFAGPPFVPERLASFQGVYEVQRCAMQVSAYLVPTDEGLVIRVNQAHSLGRQNLSICHEIAHTLIPTYDGYSREDLETGVFDNGVEEERLCDIGGAALLMDERWYKPHALSLGPSLASLFELASIFGASIQAAAWQCAELMSWPCAYVFWEMGFRKKERETLEISMLPGLEEMYRPKPELRLKSRYTTRTFQVFLPRNKSVESQSLIAQCCETAPYTEGLETLLIG